MVQGCNDRRTIDPLLSRSLSFVYVCMTFLTLSLSSITLASFSTRSFHHFTPYCILLSCCFCHSPFLSSTSYTKRFILSLYISFPAPHTIPLFIECDALQQAQLFLFNSTCTHYDPPKIQRVNRIYHLVQLETRKFGGKLAGIKLPNGNLAIQRTCRELGDIVTRSSIGTHLTKIKMKKTTPLLDGITQSHIP